MAKENKPLQQEQLDRRFALDLQNVADLMEKRGRKFLIIYETKDGAASVHNMKSKQLEDAAGVLSTMITRSNVQEGIDKIGDITFNRNGETKIPESN